MHRCVSQQSFSQTAAIPSPSQSPCPAICAIAPIFSQSGRQTAKPSTVPSEHRHGAVPALAIARR
eukprot:1923110-Prorocentrum_lima.AAC.1